MVIEIDCLDGVQTVCTHWTSLNENSSIYPYRLEVRGSLGKVEICPHQRACLEFLNDKCF